MKTQQYSSKRPGAGHEYNVSIFRLEAGPVSPQTLGNLVGTDVRSGQGEPDCAGQDGVYFPHSAIAQSHTDSGVAISGRSMAYHT